MVNISPLNYSQLSSCDATTAGGTWAGNSAGTEVDFLKEGAACLGFTIRTIGANVISFAPTTALDLSGTKHLRLWFLSTTPNSLQTLTNGGVQFYITSGSVTGYYYVLGKNTYPGGWYNLVVDLSRAADSGSKPPSMAGISSLGLNMICTSAPKHADNTWIDNFIYCDGLRCSGSTQFGLSDIYDLDNSTGSGYGLGIVRKINDVYYFAGNLRIGDNNGTGTTDFKETNQLIVFEDRKVNADLYGISATGNTTGTTSFQLGNKSGTAGIQGCTIKSVVTGSAFKILATGSNVNANTFKLYGCTLLNSGLCYFPSGSTNNEVLNCSFSGGQPIYPDTCKVRNTNIISATGSGLIMTGSHDVTDSTLISCPSAVEITTAGNYTFSNLKFSGNTVDVDNTSGGTVNVSMISGSDASQAKVTGDTTLTSENTLTVTGIVAGSEIRLLESGSYNEITGSESSSTSFSYQYSYSPDTYVHIIIHSLGYEYMAINNYLLSNVDTSFPISQRLDRVYSNP